MMSKEIENYENQHGTVEDGLHTEEYSIVAVDVATDVDIDDRGRSAFTNYQSPLYDNNNNSNNINNSININPVECNAGVSFCSHTDTNNADDILSPPTTNTQVYFWNRRPISGTDVQRINTHNNNSSNSCRGSSKLPQAYPVLTSTHRFTSRRRQENEIDQRKMCSKVTLMRCFATFLGIIIFLNIMLYVLMFIEKSSLSKSFSGQYATGNSTNLTEAEAETPMQNNSSNVTKLNIDSFSVGEMNHSFYNATEEENEETNSFTKNQSQHH